MMARTNFKFVERAVGEFRNEVFPETDGPAVGHGMETAIRLIDVSQGINPRGIRRQMTKWTPVIPCTALRWAPMVS